MTRVSRVLVALAGLALVVAVQAPLASAGEAEPLPEREVSSKVTDRANRLVLRGNVNPGWEGKPVLIQKRKCLKKSCSWYRWAEVTTNDKGGFRQQITAPRKGSWYWRAKVPAGDGYAASFSQAWRSWMR